MRRRLFLQICLAVLFLIAALLAFSNNLNSYFLSDDFVQIGKVLSGDFSVVWGQSHGGFFRPLFILSYIVDSRVWHARPQGYHLTNVAIHALNSFLVFQVARQFLRHLASPANISTAMSIAASTLFLLHPSHTEAVTWISGRADLLATCLCLASLWCFMVYATGSRASFLALAVICCAAALLAKESAICLPFLILIVGVYLSRKRETLLAFGALTALLIAFLLMRAFFIGSFIGGYGAGQHLNFSPRWIGERLLEAEVRSISPALPDAWSSFLFRPLQSPIFIFIALATCGLVAVLVVIRRKRYHRSERKAQNKFLLVLYALFLVSLLPASNLRVNMHNSLGERFLYLPTVFSCLMLSYVSVVWIRKPRVWLIVLICALGFYGWRLYVANTMWREAARMSFLITQELPGSGSTKRLAILNAPDNLRGVPVFHNGLPEMLQFFQNQREVEQVDILSFQSLQSRFDEVYLRQSNDTLRLEHHRRDAFTRTSSAECLELVAQSEFHLQIRMTPCASQTDVYFFSGGQMRRIAGALQ